eukprot:187454-Pyramimonas_sp.AAC.1
MRLWIGNISKFLAGPRQTIRKVMVQVLYQTSQMLDADGLKVAAKSVAPRSKLPDAKLIFSELKAEE